MSVVDSLGENDPARTGITISLRNEPSDADLAQALQHNPFITAITVNLEGVQTTNLNWGDFLRVIETRGNLVKVTLMDAIHVSPAPAAFVSAILRAIQQNAAIRSVMMATLCLPINLCSFVDTASSMTSFSLCCCVMEPVEREQGTRDLAVALQRTTNINTMEIVQLNDIYAIPILQGLRSNISLKNLFIGSVRDFSTATAQAIQQLLESTTSIQTIELSSPSFKVEEFSPVAQGIISSQSLSELKLSCCRLRDEESAALFRNILQNKRNLTSLCLNCCSFSAGRIYEDMISALLRPNSPLKSFKLQERSLGEALPNGQFQDLLRAIEKSKLERFAIGYIQSQQQLRTLTDSIPLMRIKELQVVIADDFVEENIKQLLLQAVKNNFSLRSVQGDRDGESIFDDDDETRLTFLADRNEHLDQWVDNPESIEQKVWPEALKLAERAGPNSLFQGLCSVLEGDSSGLRAAGRKRKRPQFYAPS